MEIQVESKWLKSLNPNPEIIDLHPLQFANGERINRHKVVYIFDEVGSGKTISSGIMALEYLENNPDENILVITTNALVSKTTSQKHGQFMGDWLKKLPFEILGYDSRITVVNNHYSKFKAEQNYGLVIIDEAHLFLNEKTTRYKNLTQNIRADKVVFLTATPIKETSEDLNKYVKMARMLIDDEKYNYDLLGELSTYCKEPSDLISSTFSLGSQVTRYFKDTIKALGHEGFVEKKAKRSEILIWDYCQDQEKNLYLLSKLKGRLDPPNENRFVIFVRLVNDEAEVIGGMLKENGFCEFEQNTPINKRTYKIVTGDNGKDLADFSTTEKEKLPTVLILTYQIAEQGVNLPGFNHIVNYHIPSFPSSLEQRYGRIDRINSEHERIYNCFLINRKSFDTNTLNFYSAIYSNIHSLLGAIPSRNTLLSKKTLQSYMDAQDLLEKYINEIRDLLTDKNLDNLYKYLKTHEVDTYEPLIDGDLRILINFTKVAGIELEQSDELEAKQQLKQQLTEPKKHFSSIDREKDSIGELLKVNENLWDQIFYSQRQVIDDRGFPLPNLNTIDPVDGCAKMINGSQEYERYLKEFNQSIRLPLEFVKYRNKLNSIFEKAFMDNEFEKLFPQVFSKSYSDVLLSDIENIDPLVKENLDSLIPTLSFFRMVDQFRRNLEDTIYIKNRNIYMGTELCKRKNLIQTVFVNPFSTALISLIESDFSFSEDIRREIYLSYVSNGRSDENKIRVGKLFNIEANGSADLNKPITLKASIWLKIAYYFIMELSKSNENNYDHFAHILYDGYDLDKYTKKRITTRKAKFRQWSETWRYDFKNFDSVEGIFESDRAISYDDEITKALVKLILPSFQRY